MIVQYRSAEGWFGSRLLKCGTVGSSELALVGDAICRVTAPLVLALLCSDQLAAAHRIHDYAAARMPLNALSRYAASC